MEGKRSRHGKGAAITGDLAHRQGTVQRQEDTPVDQGVEYANIYVGRKMLEQHRHSHVPDSVGAKRYPPDTDRGDASTSSDIPGWRRPDNRSVQAICLLSEMTGMNEPKAP